MFSDMQTKKLDLKKQWREVLEDRDENTTNKGV